MIGTPSRIGKDPHRLQVSAFIEWDKVPKQHGQTRHSVAAFGGITEVTFIKKVNSAKFRPPPALA
jgi:hypothetical protein